MDESQVDEGLVDESQMGQGWVDETQIDEVWVDESQIDGGQIDDRVAFARVEVDGDVAVRDRGRSGGPPLGRLNVPTTPPFYYILL